MKDGIDVMLNSRPLLPCSKDPSDFGWLFSANIPKQHATITLALR